MTIHRIKTTDLMSQVVVHHGTVYLSGQVSFDNVGGPLTSQAVDIFAKIDALLQEAGTDKSRMLSLTIWLRRTEDFEAFNAAWLAWLADSKPPARATVCGVELALPGLDIEISVIAGL